MRESDIEKYLIKQVKAAKGEINKLQWIGRRGAPDRFVMLPHVVCFAEVKAPGKKPEDYQLREHRRLERFGVPVIVIDSLEKVDFLCDPSYEA